MKDQWVIFQQTMFDDRMVKFAMKRGHRGVIEVSLGSRLEWLKLVWLNN
jgi:hypothetical protein